MKFSKRVSNVTPLWYAATRPHSRVCPKKKNMKGGGFEVTCTVVICKTECRGSLTTVMTFTVGFRKLRVLGVPAFSNREMVFVELSYYWYSHDFITLDGE